MGDLCGDSHDRRFTCLNLTLRQQTVCFHNQWRPSSFGLDDSTERSIHCLGPTGNLETAPKAPQQACSLNALLLSLTACHVLYKCLHFWWVDTHHIMLCVCQDGRLHIAVSYQEQGPPFILVTEVFTSEVPNIIFSSRTIVRLFPVAIQESMFHCKFSL